MKELPTGGKEGRKVETHNAIWDKLHFICVKCETADTCCLTVSTTRICTHSKIIF